MGTDGVVGKRESEDRIDILSETRDGRRSFLQGRSNWVGRSVNRKAVRETLYDI